MTVFFASDVHLGTFGNTPEGTALEDRFIEWLEIVRCEGDMLFLLGDIFDFWYEHKRCIPKGYTSALSKLRELSRSGIEIHFFKGNHDEWTRDYLSSYIGMTIHDKEPEIIAIDGKRIAMGHGHSLGLDKRLHIRLMRLVFNSKLAFYLASHILHPNLMLKIGSSWSRYSMLRKRDKECYQFKAEDNALVDFAREYKEDVDMLMFGHFHTPTIYPLDNKRDLVILGDWIRNPYYGIMIDGKFELKKV